MGIIKLKKSNEERTKNAAIETPQVSKSADVVQTNANNREERKKQWEDSAVLYEDKTKTDEMSRHYVLNNGTAKSVFNAEPVSFFDEEKNDWEYFDHSLKEKADVFESKNGKFVTRISKVHKGKQVDISKADKQISWEYLGKQGVSVANEENKIAAETVLKVNSATSSYAKNINSSAVYENIESDTDLEYCLLGNNLKENIIVKERSAGYRYLFALKTEGLKLRLSEDNESLELYTESEDADGIVKQQVEFSIPSPYMYDANGVASDEVYYELETTEAGKYAFAVVASEEWINAVDRAFPVTIDPQIVASQNNLVTKQAYQRNVYSNSSSGSGVSYGSWNKISTTNIKVSRSAYSEYKTILTIKRSLINLITDNIVSVKLVLTPLSSFSGYLYCNGTWTYYNTANGNLQIDITNSFKKYANDFDVTLVPYSYADMQFYMSGEAPRIEIQTLADENASPVKKSYSLAGAFVGEVNFLTGEIIGSYTDIPSRNILLGLAVSHVYKKHSSDLHVGKNFRLNLHEQFMNNGGTYEYTDASGNVYGFKEYHYYFDDNGNKVYISASKNEITVGADGRLTYGDKEVFSEHKSLTGLKAITKIEEYLHSEYFEDRGDEEKQYGDQCENYKQSLGNYVAISDDATSVIYLEEYISNNAAFQNFLKVVEYRHVMTKSERDTYEILKEQLAEGKSSSEGQITKMQIADIESRSDDNLAQIKRLYKEYVNIKEKLNQCQLETPINYLTDEKLIKGYNKYGQLVRIFDRYGNYVSVEYERYDVNNFDKTRIKQVYDNQKNLLVFSYNRKGMLANILDTNGRKVKYVYNGELLTEIKDDNGIHLQFAYDEAGNITTITEKKNQLISTFAQTADTLSIVNKSLVSLIKADGVNSVTTTDSDTLSEYGFVFTRNSYQQMSNVLVTGKNCREKYIFNLNGSLFARYIEENGVVTKAEQYEFQSYWNGNMAQDNPRSVTKTAATSSLYKVGLDSYSFVAGDTETTVLDQFNKPESKTTSAVLVSEWIDSNGISQQNKQTTVVNYIYDDSQMLIEEKTTATYSNPVKTVVSHKKYNYNAYGDVIRTESYVEGEEYTAGKTIEETVYDEKGNVIKSFTYNSLDASSKFYTEKEYDENNKVSAEFDETGENKTNFGYVDGTNIVREKALPNGSKFAYGYDYDDTVTAISQSTEDGEENSTQKTYRCGEVVELRSGNNNVKYEYDYKRKLKAVDLNGVENYVQYSYAETQDDAGNITNETLTTTYASGDSFVSEKDSNGNLLKLTANGADQIENVYDKKGQLDTLKDNVAGKNIKFERDELDNVTAIYEIDSNGIKVSGGYAENLVYDALGKVNKRTITGSVSQEYTYGYKTDSTHALDSITVNGSTIMPKLDVLGRNKGKEICIGSDKIAEESIAYRKVGDHATNMPTTIRFGNKFGDKFALVDSLRYVYDKMGNIEKVYENGELAIRYQYDALNRLIREDNKIMSTTVLYSYDNNGNILKQRKFAFTLKDITDIEELESEDKVYIYDGDKLLSFNGAECAYNETTDANQISR